MAQIFPPPGGGDGAEIGPNDKGFVEHGATASTARPADYGSVEWVGSVEPDNADDDDTWIDTAGSVDAKYGPQVPGVVSPMCSQRLLVRGSNPGAPGTNLARFARCIIPKSGTMHSFSYWSGGASGNILGMVYDVGEASAGNYSLLWSSASTAAAGTNVWTVLGDPALTVTQGQQVLLGYCYDNGTATHGALTDTAVVAAAGTLPTGVLPDAGNDSGKICSQRQFGGFAAEAAISEANMLTVGFAIAVMARVS